MYLLCILLGYPRGLYFNLKMILIPAPLSKNYIFPLLRYIIFVLLLSPFCLNSSLFCIYFTLLLPNSFFFFLSSFFFSISPFSLPLLIFFPHRTSADIFSFPRGGGGGYFPIFRPWGTLLQIFQEVKKYVPSSNCSGEHPLSKQFNRRSVKGSQKPLGIC
jgi:hypothetical protein